MHVHLHAAAPSNTKHDELNATTICQQVISCEQVHQENQSTCTGHEHQENTIIHVLEEALKTCNVEHSHMLFIPNEVHASNEQLKACISNIHTSPLHLKLDILELFSHPCNLLTPPIPALATPSQSHIKQGSSQRKPLSATGQRNEIYFHSYSTVKEKKKRGRPRMYVHTFQKLDND